MNVQELHDMVAAMHRRYYDMGGPERQIEIMLCAVVHGRTAFVEMEARDRVEWYTKASAVLAAVGADAYCVATEAWSASASPNDPASRVPPSKRECRSEVVVTVCVDRAGDRASSILEIVRGPDGRVAELRHIEGMYMTDGAMFHLL
jgi:hypothetical protein